MGRLDEASQALAAALRMEPSNRWTQAGVDEPPRKHFPVSTLHVRVQSPNRQLTSRRLRFAWWHIRKFKARQHRIRDAQLAGGSGRSTADVKGGGEGGGEFAGAIRQVVALEASARLEAARDVLMRLSEQHPDNADVRYRLAWNRYSAKDYYPAHEAISAALQLAPAHEKYRLRVISMLIRCLDRLRFTPRC
jgi:tetratricopeptide (TPR) repeat protein